MGRRPANPGDRIEEHLTTGVFNELIKKRAPKPIRPNIELPPNPATVQVSGSFAASPYDPVELTGPYFSNDGTVNDPENPYYRYPHCSVSNSLTEDKWIVLQGYLGSGQPALATVLGLTWVKANVTDLTHTHLTVSAGALVSGTKGKARIIAPPPATGVGFVLALLSLSSAVPDPPCLPDTIVENWDVTATGLNLKLFTRSTCTSSGWITVFSWEDCTV